MYELEQWRWVVGYEGLYQVSDLGQVRSVDRVVPDGKGGTKRLKGRIRASNLNGGYGHLTLVLCKNGKQRSVSIHQLVAAAWIGPCPNGQQVRHGPTGKLDNSVSNLCYGNPSKNGCDRRRDGTHGGRPVRRSDGAEFINMAVAGEETGCWVRNIRRVCNGIYKTAGRYGWEYI